MNAVDFLGALTIPCSDCGGKGHGFRVDKRYKSGTTTERCWTCSGMGRRLSEFGEKLVRFLKDFGDFPDREYVDQGDRTSCNCVCSGGDYR